MINVSPDVILGLVTIYLVVISVVSLWLISKMSLVLRRNRRAGDLVSDVISGIYAVIDEKERRIVDLMYRLDILEAIIRRERVKGGSGWAQFERSTRDVGVSRDVTQKVTPVQRPAGLSVLELSLLRQVHGGPRKVSDITKEVGKSREHTSRILGKLVRGGLMERSTTSEGVVYSITVRGKGMM